VESNTALTRLLFFPHQHLQQQLLIATTSLDINNIIF